MLLLGIKIKNMCGDNMKNKINKLEEFLKECEIGFSCKDSKEYYYVLIYYDELWRFIDLVHNLDDRFLEGILTAELREEHLLIDITYILDTFGIDGDILIYD